ncbi:MAG: PEP-CTERM sorting domain-containing protein [Betaproteobacteria bacterium]|nr:PEP-CTERM sorting domain-containing protein [Betaproteobacteria bacterium]
MGGQYSPSDYSFSDAFTSTGFDYVLLFGFACDATRRLLRLHCDKKAQFAIDNISVVPEPAQWLLMGLGLAAPWAPWFAAATRRPGEVTYRSTRNP